MAELEQLERKVDTLIDTVHKLQQALVARLEPPVELLNLEQAAKLIGKKPDTLRKIARKGVFTDNRGGKTQGSDWLFCADEIDEFPRGGELGVKRLRQQLGRL